MSSCTPQLDLSPAALHAPTHREPHVDSEEAVQYERRRVSRELEPIYPRELLRQSVGARHTSSVDASLRSRNASLRDSSASQEHLRRQAEDANTQAYSAGVSEDARSSIRTRHWWDPIATFWRTHVSLTIDEGAHRDHLALERTFLGYLRTSLILVMTGVLIAQLFRLQHVSTPNPDFGFFVIGRPLSITFIASAILVMLVGAFRFWKLQGGLVRGKAYTGGWEVLVVMGLSGFVSYGMNEYGGVGRLTVE
ncbi:hypothetical protein CC86DRAFT_366680 [Ophiobolus disseminans]|uniref:DUF202 domain-containing protein n=1 Tax=Ophiobolus disseminans TaxID=1469910 RepID=A0A6A7ADA0_9PLEO|nr:hypothetical protein CC86DRAFT_366680 [Ophiobolus disseminans]